jgi:hypothetical protein
MSMRQLIALVGIICVFVLLLSTNLGLPPRLLALQVETRLVTVERLAATPPLPFAVEPTTASLERIVIAPGASSETTFNGPVLLYIEEGALKVDWDRHKLGIVQTGDQIAIRGEQRIRKGTIPSGYGVYSADGQPGPLVNAGDTNLKMLAVLFVPQPLYESEGETMSATAGPPTESPTP